MSTHKTSWACVCVCFLSDCAASQNSCWFPVGNSIDGKSRETKMDIIITLKRRSIFFPLFFPTQRKQPVDCGNHSVNLRQLKQSGTGCLHEQEHKVLVMDGNATFSTRRSGSAKPRGSLERSASTGLHCGRRTHKDSRVRAIRSIGVLSHCLSQHAQYF